MEGRGKGDSALFWGDGENSREVPLWRENHVKATDGRLRGLCKQGKKQMTEHTVHTLLQSFQQNICWFVSFLSILINLQGLLEQSCEKLTRVCWDCPLHHTAQFWRPGLLDSTSHYVLHHNFKVLWGFQEQKIIPTKFWSFDHSISYCWKSSKTYGFLK